MCPVGLKFGINFEDHDECDKCKLYANCGDAFNIYEEDDYEEDGSELSTKFLTNEDL